MQLHWLAPVGLMLLGLALLPILAHLIRRPPQERRVFGAMMLLQRMQEHYRKRNRIQDWLLLLLRMLLLLCIGLAMLQPELRWPDPNRSLERSALVVVAIDTSLSMNQLMEEENQTALDVAKDKAILFVKELPTEISISVLTIGDQSIALTDGFSEDRSEVLAALSTIQQTEQGSNLRSGLQQARRLFDGRGGEIFLYTDEAGPTLFDSIAEEIKLLLSQKISLIPEIVRPDDANNVVVTTAQYGEGVEGGTVRFSVMNYGSTSKEAHCIVSLPDGTTINTFVEALPEQETKSFVTVPRVMEGGVGKIHVEDPYLELDNDYHFHLPRIGASRILVVDGDPGVTTVTSEVYFLERALSPWGMGDRNAGILPDVVGAFGISSLDVTEHRVVFLANVSEPSNMAGRLLEFVRNGGGLVMSLGSNVSAERYNSAFADLLPVQLRKIEQLVATEEEGLPTMLPDATIELFSPFLRGGLDEFSKVRWQKIFSVEPYQDSEEVRTLLRLENGYPLLLEKNVGSGKVLLLNSTIDLQWGNFPLRSVYMPLIQRMVSYLGGASNSGLRVSGEIGQPIAVNLNATADNLIWDGSEGKMSASLLEGKVWLKSKRSGAYRLSVEGGPAMAWVALNTAALESDIRVTKELLASAAEIAPDHFLEKHSLARWLILAALVLMLIQAMLSKSPPTEEKVA